MKIEELSDDFTESVNISEAQTEAQTSRNDEPIPGPDLLTQAMNAFASNATPTTNDDGSAGPQLPPGLAAMRDKTADEMLQELNKTPLFMTSLEENDDVEALRALAYEGMPAEVAQGFKEHGNETFKQKGWKDAKEFYTKAVQVLLIEVRKRQNSSKEEQKNEDAEEVKKEIALLEACLVNRAACHLELKNFRSCTMDCGSALRINGKNVKAYYRSARALWSLGKIAEADDACARGLAIDPENVALRAVARDIIKKNEEVSAKKKRDLERQQRKWLEEKMLRTALKARGVKLRTTEQPPEMEDAKIELVPDPVDPTSTLSFPTVLLYPLHLQSDFIKSFNETETLTHHLSYILPLPWDKERTYTPLGVECYIETVKGGLLKVGKKAVLLKILSSESVMVVDEVVKIFVVPKSKADAWVQDFKKKSAAAKSS